MCDGVIFPGGFKLTKYDRFALDYLNEKDIPVLGICLGMQILSSYKEDLCFTDVEKSDIIHNQETPTGVSHEVTIDKNSKLYSILKKEKIMVNSFHKKKATPNKYYKTVAYAPDDVIEAIELQDKTFSIGVQWHPELMAEYDKNNQELMKYFVESCRKG